MAARQYAAELTPAYVVPRRRFLKPQFRSWLWGYFFILPSFAMFIAFSLYPMYSTAKLSFQHFTLMGSEWVGLENYRELWSDPDFHKVLKNTLLFALALVPLGVLLSLVLSTLIIRLPSRVQVFYKSAFYLPVVSSGVVLSLIWLYLYDPAFGLINYLLGKFGISPVLWLSNPHTSLISIAMMYHASHWGGAIILLTASIGGIPTDLYEAARLDGASYFKQTTSITVPLLRPAIAYVAITGTIASLQIFTEIMLMTRGGPDYATTNMVYSIYDYGFIRFDYGSASAIAMMLLIITVVIALVQFRVLRSNFEY